MTLPTRPPVRASRPRLVAAARWAADLLELVLPVTCVGCGAGAVVLCGRCAVAWSGPPRRCEHGAPRLDRVDGTVLPVWALAENAGPARQAVVAWKDRGRADATPAFAALLGRAVARLVDEPGDVAPPDAAPPGPVPPGVAAAASPGPGTAGPLAGPPLVVVPAPSSRRGRAERGEDLVLALARACAAHGPPGSAVVPALRLHGQGRDQVGLGVRGRAANLRGRVRVRPGRAASLQRARVLLVDDVLTTGATLAACRAAVEAAGGSLAGAVVLAVTRPPGAATAWLVECSAGG